MFAKKTTSGPPSHKGDADGLDVDQAFGRYIAKTMNVNINKVRKNPGPHSSSNQNVGMAMDLCRLYRTKLAWQLLLYLFLTRLSGHLYTSESVLSGLCFHRHSHYLNCRSKLFFTPLNLVSRRLVSVQSLSI